MPTPPSSSVAAPARASGEKRRSSRFAPPAHPTRRSESAETASPRATAPRQLMRCGQGGEHEPDGPDGRPNDLWKPLPAAGAALHRNLGVRRPAPTHSRAYDNCGGGNRGTRTRQEIRAPTTSPNPRDELPHQDRALHRDISTIQRSQNWSLPRQNPPPAPPRGGVSRPGGQRDDQQVGDPADSRHLEPKGQGRQQNRQQIEVAQEPDQVSVLEKRRAHRDSRIGAAGRSLRLPAALAGGRTKVAVPQGPGAFLPSSPGQSTSH